MIRAVVMALLFALPAYAQVELDVAAVPGLNEAGRHAYADFLLTDLPRAFAIGSNGAYGYYGSDGYRVGNGDIEVARAGALQACSAKGATDCTPYAENLDIVWGGRARVPNLVPDAFTSTWNYEIIPDNRFFWHGPSAAVGVFVWGHGTGGGDLRGKQPPPYARALNDVGFDIVRFDRQPDADANRDRVAGWLADTLEDLRHRGYRRIVVGGQSRGGWNSLQMLTHVGLADAVIAVSPAAQGIGNGTRAQYDDLRQLFEDVPPQRTRLAFVQFTADPYATSFTRRIALVEGLRPRLGNLLVIDQPEGLSGHYGGNTARFASGYAECLRHFVMDITPPKAC
jgi:hypothetical protein